MPSSARNVICNFYWTVRVRVSGGDLCAAEAPTGPAGETTVPYNLMEHKISTENNNVREKYRQQHRCAEQKSIS